MKKFIYSIYQWVIAVPVLAVVTFITAVVTIIWSQFNSDAGGYYPAKWWSRCMCAVLLVTVVVKGRENIRPNEPYVFAANHQGAFDIFALQGYLGHNFKWMMRKGLTNIPLVGTACRAAGYILVDTHSAHGMANTIVNAEQALQRGQSLIIFPEGRRTDDGSMGTFKPGAFKLAAEFKRPIVPITIDGAYRVMSRTAYVVTPGSITITIHQPIEPGADGHDIDDLSARCREAIASGLSLATNDDKEEYS